MGYVIQRIKAKRILLTQLLFTVLAFAAMVILSYFFMGTNVHESLMRNAASILNSAEGRVAASLIEPRATVEGFAETMRRMIVRGDSAEMLQNYINDISDYIFLSGQDTSGVRGLYVYIEALPGGPVFMHNPRWTPPEDYKPTERRWYKMAVQSGGGIVETSPSITGSSYTVFTYAVCMTDAGGRRLGVVCLEVRVDSIGQDVVHTALAQGGYGMLLNQDFLVFAHPNLDFVGRHLRDPLIPVCIFADDLQKGLEVSERPVMSFRNEPAVAFFRRLDNGWYLGLVTPENQYYRRMTYMAAFLSILGATLAAALMAILIHIDAAKDKSDTESRQKSTFLANMSHEIRTPINAIIGMTAIGKAADGTERKDYCFGKIDDASQHLLGVITDILDISKIEADKFELSPVEFRFEDIIRRVENVIIFRIEQKRQKFEITIDEKIPAILTGDDQRLMQVIINLLSNAVKFTPDDGNIHLNAYLAAEEDGVCTIVIEISDTGIGIAPEHQSKLFRSFAQADSGTSRKYGGTGLGLVISKRIVEMMGGTIGVSSTLGSGSVFTFSFRAARGKDNSGLPSDTQESDAALPGEFAGCRILLAEDVEINREIILAYMEGTGAEIDCAENGIAALKKFNENPEKYDLIFMDVQMPEMDGLEVTRQLRSRGVTTPIIAMTANVFKEDIERCIEAGMDGHLGKPLDMDDVLKAVRKYRTQKTSAQ